MRPAGQPARAPARHPLQRWRALALALTGSLLAAACTSHPTANPPASAASAAVAGDAMRTDSSRYIVLAVDNPLENPSGRAGSTMSGYGPSPRYLQGGRAAATLAAIAREHGLREAAGWPIATLGWQCVVFELPPGRSREAVLTALSHDPRVRLAQPLQDFDTRSAPQPAAPSAAASAADAGLHYNDPYVHLQRGFVDTAAARAHRVSTGAGVRVAVVDTGAALDHPDLLGRIALARNLVDEAGLRAVEPDRHGTEVAGVIAAVGNNGEGIVGIAPQARLVVLRACWPREGPAGAAAARCNSFTLAKALAAVLESDARIVNLSLGGPNDPLLEKLLAELLRQGRVVIGALPPDGRRGGFPTGTPGVIAAGVAGEVDATTGQEVLAAPGRDVLTLQPGGRYDYASGSSIAAAHVSGVAALILAAQPRLDRTVLFELLRAGSNGPSTLNAGNALEALTPARVR
jgi:hypothetical protein